MNISGQNIVIEAEKIQEMNSGYVAVDEFLILPGLDRCDVMPPEANIDNQGTTTPSPTKPPNGK